MTLLYRSPNVRIDDADWHVTVETHHKTRRVIVVYRWRTDPKRAWQKVEQWPGRLPKALHTFFQPYKHSIRVAAGGAHVASAYSTRRMAA